MVAVEVERMLRLAEQCLERAKSFIEKTTDPPDPSAAASPSSSCSPAQPEHPQTDALPATTAANTGDYIGPSSLLLKKKQTTLNVQAVLTWSLPQGLQIKSNTCTAT